MPFASLLLVFLYCIAGVVCLVDAWRALPYYIISYFPRTNSYQFVLFADRELCSRAVSPRVRRLVGKGEAACRCPPCWVLVVLVVERRLLCFSDALMSDAPCAELGA
eukprot:1049038-Prymnesium_polylepis.1